MLRHACQRLLLAGIVFGSTPIGASWYARGAAERVVDAGEAASEPNDGTVVKVPRDSVHRLTPTPGATRATAENRRGGIDYDPTSVYDQRGSTTVRGFSVQAPHEAIDPYTGNLVLRHVDLFLPGVAGLDVTLHRFYNSKIHRNYAALATGDPARIANGMLFIPTSPVGLGWHMHLGRLVGALSAEPNSSLVGPRYYERSDGSQHPFFQYTGEGCGDEVNDICLLTKEKDNPYNVDIGGPWVVNTTDGKNITFAQTATDGATVVRYATEIRDVHGNNIQIFYHDDTIPGIGIQRDYFRHFIDTIIDTAGRQIDFGYTEVNPGIVRLSSITAAGRTFQYFYSNEDPWSGLIAFLTEARPPEGGSWFYDYDGLSSGDCVQNDRRWCELTEVTYPTGGTVNYTYEHRSFWAQMNPMAVRAVTQRVSGGRAVTPGTSTYEYNRDANYAGDEHTIVTRPDNSQEVYTFFGVGNGPYNPIGLAWKAGALLQKDTRDGGGALVQRETYDWVASPPFSPEIWGDPWIGFDIGVSVPRIRQQIIQRGGLTWTTEHTAFHDSNDRARCITETGDGQTRYRLQAYVNENNFQGSRLYRFLNLMELDLASYNPFSADACDPDQSVPVALTTLDEVGQYAHSNRGQVLVEIINGIRRDFQYLADGSLRGEIIYRGGDAANPADGVCTSYSDFQAGVAREIGIGADAPGCSGPVYTVHQTVNSDGSVDTLTDGRGFTTDFDYDGLGRLTRIVPPPQSGEAELVLTYDGSAASPSTMRRLAQGAYWIETHLDGFGREIETATSAGVYFTKTYDALGRAIFQGLPSASTGSTAGDTFMYDALGRPAAVTHVDSSGRSYAYGANEHNVTITDELTRETVHTRRASGSPGDFQLVRVQLPGEAAPAADTYTYLVGGHLFDINYAGTQRFISYNYPKLIAHEYSPESGNIFFGYDAAGSLRCRDRGGDDSRCNDQELENSDAEVLYTVDTLGRNTATTYADHATPDAAFTYDNADNIETMNDGVGAHAFTYSAANRMESRESVINGVTYTTGYTYDGRGNLETITYPSGRVISYEYDAGNRVTRVHEGGKNYASNISYHPNALISGMTYGNGITTTSGLDPRQRPRTKNASGVATLTYGYDDVGNVRTLTDGVTGYSGSFFYDSLDRLEDANGPWGSLHYDYYAGGDRMQVTRNGQPTNYQYDSFGQLLATTGGDATDFIYDDFGNTVARLRPGSGGFGYKYDAENRITQVENVRSDGTSHPVVGYGYDGRGQRMIVSRGGCGRNLVYHYDKDGNRIAESTFDGTMLTEYIILRGQTIAEIDLREEIPGDFDGDLDRDTTDFRYVTLCMSGPFPQSFDEAPGCVRADFDGDSDVDLRDVSEMLLAVDCVPSDPAVGACCFNNGLCSQSPAESCSLEGGSYQGDGTVCAQVDCPILTGACCHADGSCTDGLLDECAAAGGTFQGGGSACSLVLCPQPQGACCLPDTSCAEGSEDDCDLATGEFQGIDTTCADVVCAVPGYSNVTDLADFGLFAPTAGVALADDLSIAGAAGCTLTSIQIGVYANAGGPYDVTASLFDACPDTGSEIPNTAVSWQGVAADGLAQILNAGVPSVAIPDTVWLVVTFSTDEAAWIVAGEAEEGSTADRFGWESQPWNGCLASFGGEPYAGFYAELTCE